MDERKIIDALHKIRVSKGITQEDLAQKLHITKQAIQSIENGRNKLTLQRLFEICEALRIQVKVILPEAGKENW